MKNIKFKPLLEKPAAVAAAARIKKLEREAVARKRTIAELSGLKQYLQTRCARIEAEIDAAQSVTWHAIALLREFKPELASGVEAMWRAQNDKIAVRKYK